MPLLITGDCTNCTLCEPECPNDAISEGDEIFEIDPLLCTECVGFNETPACADVCPVECCIDDPANQESEIVLVDKAQRLHPEQPLKEPLISRYRTGDRA